MQKFSLSILASENCNLNCSYCYESKCKNDKNISFKKACELIDNFKNDSNFNNHIQFFGGEPTLNYKVIDKIIETYPDISFSIITNGTWIYNDEIIKVMKKIKSVNISIEGTDLAFKVIRNRRYPLQIVQAIKNNNFKDVVFNISINGLLVENLKEFIELIDNINEYGYYYHIYTLRTENDYFDSNKEYYKFLTDLRKLNEDLYLEIIDIKRHGKYDKLLDIPNNDPGVNWMCSFDNNITIRHDGSISPCARFPDIKINKSDIGDPNEFLYTVSDALAHKSQYRCNSCILRHTWACKLRCPAFHIEMETNQDKMNMLCERELIKYELRQQFWKEHPELLK